MTALAYQTDTTEYTQNFAEVDYSFLRFLQPRDLAWYLAANSLPFSAQTALNHVLAARTEKLVAQATLFQVLSALAKQVSGHGELFSSLRIVCYHIFTVAGVLAIGKNRFCEMLFVGNDSLSRSEFSRDLLLGMYMFS